MEVAGRDKDFVLHQEVVRGGLRAPQLTGRVETGCERCREAWRHVLDDRDGRSQPGR